MRIEILDMIYLISRRSVTTCAWSVIILKQEVNLKLCRAPGHLVSTGEALPSCLMIIHTVTYNPHGPPGIGRIQRYRHGYALLLAVRAA